MIKNIFSIPKFIFKKNCGYISLSLLNLYYKYFINPVHFYLNLLKIILFLI